MPNYLTLPVFSGLLELFFSSGTFVVSCVTSGVRLVPLEFFPRLSPCLAVCSTFCRSTLLLLPVLVVLLRFPAVVVLPGVFLLLVSVVLPAVVFVPVVLLLVVVFVVVPAPVFLAPLFLPAPVLVLLLALLAVFEPALLLAQRPASPVLSAGLFLPLAVRVVAPLLLARFPARAVLRPSPLLLSSPLSLQASPGLPPKLVPLFSSTLLSFLVLDNTRFVAGSAGTQGVGSNTCLRTSTRDEGSTGRQAGGTKEVSVCGSPVGVVAEVRELRGWGCGCFGTPCFSSFCFQSTFFFFFFFE